MANFIEESTVTLTLHHVRRDVVGCLPRRRVVNFDTVYHTFAF